MFKRLREYKDLLLVFIWREFLIRYRQSIMGILWAVVQPLSMMLLFTFVFSVILKLKIADYPYVLFFYSGLLPWIFFFSSVTYSIPSLTNHYNLITKIYFPREIIPISGIAISFADFIIAFLLYLALIFFYHVHLTLNFLWFIPLTIILIMFSASVALFFSALNVYYRDVKLVSGFLLQLWFFASPILYSVDKVSLKWKVILFLNPLTFIIENMRRVTIEGRGVILWQFVLELALIVILYRLCYTLFIKVERAFADVI